jgi:hypothetical protein
MMVRSLSNGAEVKTYICIVGSRGAKLESTRLGEASRRDISVLSVEENLTICESRIRWGLGDSSDHESFSDSLWLFKEVY